MATNAFAVGGARGLFLLSGWVLAGLWGSVAWTQEALIKAEALVRAQAVPLSRLMTFEQQNPGELLDFSAWIALRALDGSSAWVPKNRAWDLYRINMRVDLENTMRRRWQSAGGTIRSLSQNPDTSLAKHYADLLQPVDLDEVVSFYQSTAGKKFLTYQQELRRVYYRGRLTLEQVLVDESYGSVAVSEADRRREWLERNKYSLEEASSSYALHAQAMQRVFPSTPQVNLVYALVAGAPPRSQALTRLESALTESEREAVRSFLSSPAANSELAAVKKWQEAIVKSRDVLPLLLGDLRSLVELVESWRKTRADVNALPRSIAQVDAASLEVPDATASVRLEEAGPKVLRDCLPSIGAQTVGRLEDFIRTKRYLQFENSYFAPADPAIFVTRGEYGACFPITAPGYPILSGDSLSSTVNVVGMQETDLRDWRRQIAREVAASGVSESLVVFGNGNAFEVYYAVDARTPTRILYGTRFLPAGTYQRDRYRIVRTSADFKSISTTSTGSRDGISMRVKSILSTPDDLRRESELRVQR